MAISTATDGRCVHHFVFETPNGPLARGACKKCGEVKHLPNACALDRDGSTWRDYGTTRGLLVAGEAVGDGSFQGGTDGAWEAVCRYDMPPGEAQRLSHAVEIRRLADRGWDIARIAQTFHLTTRYVFNVAQAYGARR